MVQPETVFTPCPLTQKRPQMGYNTLVRSGGVREKKEAHGIEMPP